jgi:hypothetical protein
MLEIVSGFVIDGYQTVKKSMTNVSAKDLRRAADIMEKVESLQSELNSILTGDGDGDGIEIKRRGRKPKAGGDVDKYKKAHGVEKPRRKMSATAKAKISAAAKARWAKAKAAGKTTL